MSDVLEANKKLLTRYLKAVEAHDLDAIGACLAEDAVQHYQRPTNQNDDGTQAAESLTGRDNIVDEIRTYFPQLYRLDTVSVTIQTLVAEGDYIAARFTLKAVTTGRGEDYENYYFFLYRIRDGKIAEYWEYLDSRYAAAKLF